MRKNLAEVQQEMFSKEGFLLELANVFSALASDCRLEIVYLLLHTESLPSGEIGRLTNCTPSQVSQYLAKMHEAKIVQRSRTWREVTYSLNRSDPFVEKLIGLLSPHFGK